MELATAAMSPLLEKLGRLLASELTLEARVRKDVASLERELAAMHDSILRRATGDRLIDDEGSASWAREVRELAYDMEDAVDAFAVRIDDPAAAAAGFRGFLDRTARLFTRGRALHKVAGAVNDARDLARELGDLRQRYGGLQLLPAGGGSSTISELDPRVTAAFSEAADLVGVDGARDELVKLLLSSDDGDASSPDKQRVRTVSVVGAGGLGKTTLARAAYDRVKARFDRAAFVSVSRNPDVARTFKKVLEQLDEERYAGINEAVRDVEQLVRELRGCLQSQRYLIVIDDLWDEPTCEFIKSVFPKTTRGSRLITTTRNHGVAETSCSSGGDRIYKMRPLSDADSLLLFHSRVFPRGDACPPDLEQVSRDILKKCGGVPLAITTVASLLADHHHHRQAVKPKEQWHALLSSIGHGLADGGGHATSSMRRILSLSYRDLPPHLKPCALYLSVFPEDLDVERDRLIWRWIAEGFVVRREGTLFEVGEGYFVELLNRSLIQPVAVDLEGRAQACRVHDMVLDLLRYLARAENFVTVWDDDEILRTESSSTAVARRLSIIRNSSSAARQTVSKVRSLTLFNPAVESMPPLSEFRVLRVLDLEGCDLSKCGGGGRLNLRHLGDLAQLRYLGLRRTCVRELPAEVGKLKFLQTLDVRGSNNGVRELPQSITQLRSLMRLRLDWETRLPPNGLRNLRSLEELTGMRIGGDGCEAVVAELGRLAGLRLLTARWEAEADAGGEALVRALGNLRELRSLDVYVDGGRGELLRDWAPPPRLRRFVSRGPTCALPTLPAWATSTVASSLTFLDVWVGRVRSEDLQALGALPSLRGVRLRAGGSVGGRSAARTSAVRAGAFPSARACAFLHFPTAPGMFPPGTMPWVRRLEFSFRAWDVVASGGGGGGGGFGLEDLRMGHLPSLEEVHVELWHRKEDDAAAVRRVAAALRQAAEEHPNRVALRINERVSRRQPQTSRPSPMVI